MLTVSDCTNAALPLVAVTEARRSLRKAAALTTDGTEYIHKTGKLPPQPETAYAAFFGERLDPYLVNKVQHLYTDALLSMVEVFEHDICQKGSVYVFHDLRDPTNVVKLGRSTKPGRRLAQWRVELGLGNDPGQMLVGLFDMPTLHAPLAESVLHALLWCRQLTARVNRRTGRQLVEYFAVDDREALLGLCRAVICHVDVFVTSAGGSLGQRRV